ncbi:MAG: hypothetical protein ACI4JS_01610, partial [Oscillospiraceae bacterium]
MNNISFTGVTPDRKMQTIGIDRYIHQPDNPYTVRITGQLTYGEVFDMLKSHLEHVNMLPDEYFILSSQLDPNEHIPKDWRSFSFKTSFGGSEGIYIDISLETDKGNQEFATAKTLKSSTEDFLRMCRIAAECDLMLNGNGLVCELPKDVRDTLKERNTVHGEVCDFHFFVESFDTNNYYKSVERRAKEVNMEEAAEEYVNRKQRYPNGVITTLGVEYKTDRSDLFPHLVAGYDLNPHLIGGEVDILRFKDGIECYTDNYIEDPVLKQEPTFSN